MLKIPHCLDSRFTDGDEPHVTAALYSPEFLLFMILVLRLSKLQSLVRPEGLGKLIQFIHIIGSRTRNLPTCRTLHHYLSPVTPNNIL
jgi:hypothetical protein